MERLQQRKHFEKMFTQKKVNTVKNPILSRSRQGNVKGPTALARSHITYLYPISNYSPCSAIQYFILRAHQTFTAGL